MKNQNRCNNSDGNGGTCGNDLTQPGSMFASVVVGVPVLAQNGYIELWEWPVEPPETMNSHHLTCARCGGAVSEQFPLTTVRRSSDYQE
ncbi:hypothetical protein C4544_06830 [candidate division WS5 bacterium]|uniref:Uncharacterized protein n=1 Tax=candidate division WS5 bacterium TaxID=2093353 RepID=A0A419DAF0_9BACT|nr:MAG: hypothetical protein C4544_06830 [candidate division WS5 bacterium]